MSEGTTVSNIMLRTITIIERYLEDFDSNVVEDTTDKSNFYQQIKEYIDTHYQNPDLSVTELSALFKTNSSYLSSQFKKEFEIGLLDYITSVRISAAKKLLVTTNSPNTEICKQVGYANARTFLRAFSKSEGITPKEYRRINNPAI
jgi:YesN/AraC family two-component response regulator